MNRYFIIVLIWIYRILDFFSDEVFKEILKVYCNMVSVDFLNMLRKWLFSLKYEDVMIIKNF